jgi:phage shock protein E
VSNTNKYLILAVITTAIVGVGYGIYQTNQPANPTPSVARKTASPMETAIAEVATGKAVLIDVRTPAEFAAGHAKGAINFDSVNVEAGQLPEITTDKKIYLYCHSGRRAGIVMPIMQKAGYTDVTNLGAIQDWYDAGGPQA